MPIRPLHIFALLLLQGVNVKAIPRQAVTAPDAVVSSPAADHIEVISSDVKSSQHVHLALPARPNHWTCLQTNSTLICHPNCSPSETFPGVLSDFQHSAQRLCLFLNQDLKTFLFTQAFTEHWSDLPPVIQK